MSRARTNRRRAERARRCWHCHETDQLRVYQSRCLCRSCYWVDSAQAENLPAWMEPYAERLPGLELTWSTHIGLLDRERMWPELINYRGRGG